MQVIQLLYFAVLCVVFLFAYGVAAQSLLYPRSEENWWNILYRIFYHPYLTMFQEFHLDELHGIVHYCAYQCLKQKSIGLVFVCAPWAVSWSIFILFVPIETEMNTIQIQFI